MLAAHREWIRRVMYAPKLPLKKGERDALKTMPSVVGRHTLPLFVVPPAGDFDHELGHIPTPAEHVKAFGKKLFDCRNARPVFIDAVLLDDARHRVESDVHPLTALLERARLCKAQAWPMTGFNRSDEYQEAVARFHLRHDVPIAIQVGLAELEAADLSAKLISLCNQVSCDPTDAVLVIDAGPLHIPAAAESEFVSHLIVRLNEIPRLYEWCGVVLCATSLSSPVKLKNDEQKTIRRVEWHIHRLLCERRREIYRIPIFSDYGVDYFQKLVPNKASPVAKINYSTDEDYVYFKGQSVKTASYEAIFAVAEAVVASGHYKGGNFSLGDARIGLWSNKVGSTGNAPTWRWAALDHHFTLVGQLLALESGVFIDDHTERPGNAEQLDLVSLIPGK